MKLKLVGWCCAVALTLTFALASCSSGGEESITGDKTVTLLSITGVTTPAQGATPVTGVDTDQYEGTVTWSPAVTDTFAAATEYTATIELTAKTGYTLSGVAANAFTVSGSSSASNAANSGVVTAVFPSTSATTISLVAIPGITVPAQGATPVTTVTSDQYSGTVTWSPVVSGTFAGNTIYTATISLTPKSGYTLSGVAANAFTVDGATSASNAANSGIVTATFPSTSATTISLVAIPGLTAPILNAAPVTTVTSDQYTGTVTWNPAVSGTFAGNTIYTATISLTPKSGYTLSGVAANAFTVSGSSSASNAANSGIVTAVFPATSAGVVAVTDLDFAQSTVTLTSGSIRTLEPVFTPANATNRTVTWSTANSSVVTVDSSGTITTVAEGSADITATSADGSHVATCTVTVKDPTVYWSGKNNQHTPAQPGYWNGTAWTSVSNQANHTTGIHVQGGHVYTVGYDKLTGAWKPLVWIDTTRASLSPEASSIHEDGYTYGITGDGTSIYVAGNIKISGTYQATLWTASSGVTETVLPVGTGALSSVARDVEVEDGSVYVCGYWKNPGTQTIPSKNVPCIWTDGVIANLPVPDQTDGYATTLAVRAGKTYVGGFVVSKTDNSETPCVWVDGALTVLNGEAAAGTSRITGIDVYEDGSWVAVGWTSSGPWDPKRACRWNNQAALSYLSGTDTLYLSEATGVDILYDEVYISGTLTYANGDQSPLIWKNDDTPTSDLNNGFTTGIFIQP